MTLDNHHRRRTIESQVLLWAAFIFLLIFGLIISNEADLSSQALQSYIVTASDSETASRLVISVGGEVTSDLWIIDSVGATLTSSQKHRLQEHPLIHSIVINQRVETADAWSPEPIDGWVTRQRIKKNSYVNGDKHLSSVTRLPDGGAVTLSENGKLLIINEDHSERARVSLSGSPYRTAPVVTGDGKIYVVGEAKSVYAVSSTGESLWTYTLSGGGKFKNGLSHSGSEIIYATDDDDILYALDANSGELLWSFAANEDTGHIQAEPTISPNGTIYLLFEKGWLYALTLQGDVLWSYEATEGEPFNHSPLLAENGNILIAGENKFFYALAPSGEVNYATETDGKILAQPALSQNGDVYIATENGTLYGLQPDGQQKFVFQASDGHFQTSPLLSDDGSIVFAAVKEKVLYAIGAVDGQLLWSYLATDDIEAPPATSDNEVHFVSKDGIYTILDPYGRVVSTYSTLASTKQQPTILDNGTVYIASENELVQSYSRLPDHWDGRPDVEATDSNKHWKLANPVAIDVGADILHQTYSVNGGKITGQGVTVAVIDTGVYFTSEVKQTLGTQVAKLFVGQADFVGDGTCSVSALTKKQRHSRIQEDGYCWTDYQLSYDHNGHGTHVAGTIWNNFQDEATGVTMGIAPEAQIVSIRVLDENGYGSYEDVIQGVQYAVAHKDEHNIRVMNLSISANVTTPYFVDPLNRAVEEAWAAGIVVLAAAGNTGSGAETITVPGNDPYIITVGAINSMRTPGYWADDIIPTWSATGPTYDGFIKPDVLAPGSNIVSFMYNDPTDINNSPTLVREHPDYSATTSLFRMSGTSMATGVASGIVALMIQENPHLTPDEVKYRLMYTAQLAMNENDELDYNLLQQGAGRIWAPTAVLSADVPQESANIGMDIVADLAHPWSPGDNPDPAHNPDMNFHYYGPVDRIISDDGQYYLYVTIDSESDEVIALGASRVSDGTWIYGDELSTLNPSFENDTLSWEDGYIWSGGSRFWGGGSRFWGGGSRFWGGGSRFWGGGSRFWGGGSRFWGGGSRFWGGNGGWIDGVNIEQATISSTSWVDSP